jgi:outer membrane protein OmpA-like peptidoglycan-associated protein
MMSIAYPNVSAQFSIYADEWADRESNADLCYARGKAIMKFLAEKEIPKERIQLEYFANLRPPKSKSWEQNERSRIEVMLIFP